MDAGSQIQALENKDYLRAIWVATVAPGASLLCVPDKAWNGPAYSALL
jgi:hypothetical protein